MALDVKQLREAAGLSQQDLADKTGIPKDRLAKWEQGKGRPKSTDTAILMKFFKEYVPQETSTDNVAVPKDFITQRRDRKNNDNIFLVPLVPVRAQAGYSRGFNQTDFVNKLEKYPMLPGVDYRGGEWRYFEIEGDSMHPTFEPGQFILANQILREDWHDIKDFHVYVIVADENVMIKRLAKKKGKDYLVVISDNEKYDQTPLLIDSIKELWKFRRKIDWDASPPKKIEIKI